MIAEEAGINEALIYKYFSKKSDLLSAVVEEIKLIRPVLNMNLPDDEKEFFEGLKRFELFFLNINCEDPSILKIILFAILENYPVPDEFNVNAKGTFLNWIKSCIEKGKSEWGFDKNINAIDAVYIYMGGLIYYVLETSFIKMIGRANDRENFTEYFIKILK